jgi:hypothetical protein
VNGSLAGVSAEFEIDVLRADEQGLTLAARGPVTLDVDYRIEAAGDGAYVEAEIAIQRERPERPRPAGGHRRAAQRGRAGPRAAPARRRAHTARRARRRRARDRRLTRCERSSPRWGRGRRAGADTARMQVPTALVTGAAVITALAAPSIASAADTLVAPDPTADQITALDGTVVWVSGASGDQSLMQRSPAGVIGPVKGAPHAKAYASIDLGRDGKNRLVLTYQRCNPANTCKPMRDNLKGKRATFRHLTIKRCELTTAPALWRKRSAYGLVCHKAGSNVSDDSRSGLYVKAKGAPKRLALPKDAKKAGAARIQSVDLRGMDVAAIAADIAEFAFIQKTNGTELSTILAALSEGDSEENAVGLALGPGATMYTLTDAEHAGDPNETRIDSVQGSTHCYKTIANPPGPTEADGFAASDLAVDGATLYLVVPGTGIVIHPFALGLSCSTP